MTHGSGGGGVVRVEIHVRPMAARRAVGGTHDGALVVRVPVPAHKGQATSAALLAVANALDISPRCVTLVSGATTRRKLVEIAVPDVMAVDLRRQIEVLRSR